MSALRLLLLEWVLVCFFTACLTIRRLPDDDRTPGQYVATIMAALLFGPIIWAKAIWVGLGK